MTVSIHTADEGIRRPALKWRLRAATVFALLGIAAAGSPIAAAAPMRDRSQAKTTPVQIRATSPATSRPYTPKPGKWTRLGLIQGGTTPTFVHLPSGNDLVVWQPQVVNGKHYYESVQLRPNGMPILPATKVFGSQKWQSLGDYPQLLLDSGKALLVFQGGTGKSNDPYNDACIVGDLLGPSGWKLQSWSLSHDCVETDHFGATITKNGVLSAPFAFGGIRYQIGASPTIPAKSQDKILATPNSNPGATAAATDTKSQHIYAAWDRSFDTPPSKDGVWAADLSAAIPVAMKMPGTGTNNAAHQPEPVAMASPAARGGIYIAACNSTWPCTSVRLWRFGSKTAETVPGSGNTTSISISAGPAGRLWIAWWDATDGMVEVARTNEAGTRFGPISKYAAPKGCQSDGNGVIKISGGSQQRADVMLQCWGIISGTTYQNEGMITQSLVPLQITGPAIKGSVKKKGGESVTYRVADVGDAVAGATVTLYGKGAPSKRSTDAKGQVTFSFAKGTGPESFRVVATIANYLKATTTLHVG